MIQIPERVSAARRLARVRPTDVVLASTRLYSSLPLVGKYLEPFAGLTALALWGHQYAPSILSAAVVRRTAANAPPPATGQQADDDAAADLFDSNGDRVPPFVRARAQRRQWLYRSSIRYGDDPAQLLDIWRQPVLPAHPAPVLLFVPGGAWVRGSRVLQGHTLLAHLVKQGWVCVPIDYRVSPVHRWPRHITDVNAAIAWARANIGRYGGDPGFVAVAGCSAGGHLAALAGLTPGDPAFRGELARNADTSVDAVVGIYGRYDWQDRSTAIRRTFQRFLEQVVVGRSQSRHPDIFTAASPVARIHKKAPPFLIVHGEQDGLIPVDEARHFYRTLRAVSGSPVEYVEMRRAGHAFDLVTTSHARYLANATTDFLTTVHKSHIAEQVAASVGS
ncbi:alpha/beta hydrolase fold domain-containing protein [Mycobacterium sp.]|uniref:alpha/beta hydrolase fold domain-containing protein n=1 Tax=Mycobacterium sp. TaxID=1785 RepID=UPI003D0F0622